MSEADPEGCGPLTWGIVWAMFLIILLLCTEC